MNSLLKPAILIAAGLTLALVATASSASAQSLTLDFRFDNNVGANPTVAGATTVTLLPGTAGQTYTVDVWASISGNAANQTKTLYGLKNIKFQGFSDIVSGAGGAFGTGATLGYSGNFVGLGVFAGSSTTAPKSADTGTTTDGGSVTATPDGIIDFGKNSLLSNASQSVANYTFANANGEIEIAQFSFTTGTASTTGGATTKFVPTLPNTSTMANYTQDGSTPIIGAILSGSPLTFTVAPVVVTGTTVSVIPGPTVSVLQGGTTSLGASIQNTGTSPLAGGTYTFTASGTDATVTYGAAAPPTATTSIVNGTTQPFTFSAATATTTAIGAQTVTFTAAGSGISNAPQTGTLTLNVGNATADNAGTGSFAGASTLTATVAPGGSYANLVSQVTLLNPATTGGSDARNPANPSFGGTARILAGTNVGGSGTVSEQWRTRTALPANAANGTSEAAGTHPPLPIGVHSPLISDVLNLTGLENPLVPGAVPSTTDPFVLDMTYNYNLLPKNSAAPLSPPSNTENTLAGNKLIYLASLNPATGFYDNAVTENLTGTNNATPGQRGFLGSFATFETTSLANGGAGGNPVLSAYMGAWGIDTANHEVWAVLNHNSSFAVVPEPSTLLLAGLGLLGLVTLRRRAKTAA